MPSRPVDPRATRAADMHASVPLDTMRNISIDGYAARTASAKSTSAAVGAPKLVPRWAASTIAAMVAGWACPRIAGPQVPTRST